MKIGITGTRNGMTVEQQSWLSRFLVSNIVDELHHGDCVGVDEQADDVARGIGIKIVIHPPTTARWRAFCNYRNGKHEVRKGRDYLKRNHDIVRECGLILAFPETEVEQLRSGTWSAVRYARKKCKNVMVISPEGEVL